MEYNSTRYKVGYAVVPLVLSVLTILFLATITNAAPVRNPGQLDRADLLFRKVEWKKHGTPPEEYKTWMQDHVTLEPVPFGIHTVFGYSVRAESIWLEQIELKGDHLRVKMIHEKNDFPMDDQWDVLWERTHVFLPKHSFQHEGTIDDIDYRISLTYARLPKSVGMLGTRGMSGTFVGSGGRFNQQRWDFFTGTAEETGECYFSSITVQRLPGNRLTIETPRAVCESGWMESRLPRMELKIVDGTELWEERNGELFQKVGSIDSVNRLIEIEVLDQESSRVAATFEFYPERGGLTYREAYFPQAGTALIQSQEWISYGSSFPKAKDQKAIY